MYKATSLKISNKQFGDHKKRDHWVTTNVQIEFKVLIFKLLCMKKIEFCDRYVARCLKVVSMWGGLKNFFVITAFLFREVPERAGAGAPMEGLWAYFSSRFGVSEKIRRVHFNNPELNKIYKHNEITNTKYNLITFIPKNLMIQFGTFMNVYFFIIACLQLIHELTPVNPITIWLPLAFIFTISALKGTTISQTVSYCTFRSSR